MAKDVLLLGYEVAQDVLRQQDALLTNLRNRATTLLASSAIATTTATAVGALNTDPNKGAIFPIGAAVVVLALLSLVGASAMSVLWPTSNWHHGLRPHNFLERENSDVEDVLRGATAAMIEAGKHNDAILARRVLWLRAGAGSLLAEVVALMSLLMLAR